MPEPTLVLDGPTRVHVERWASLHEERTAARRIDTRWLEDCPTDPRPVAAVTVRRDRIADLTPGRAASDRTPGRSRSDRTPGRSRSDLTPGPSPSRERWGNASQPEGDPLVVWLGEGPAMYATLAFCVMGLVALGVLSSLTVMLLVR